MTRYDARQAVSAFFLAPTEKLRPLLPRSLSPLEARPRHGVLAITGFDFHTSGVGPYAEVALSVLVPPFCPRGEPMRHAASFPFALATTTPASAEDAEQRWGLPRYSRSVDVRHASDAERHAVALYDEGALVLRLTVGRGTPEHGDRTYQLFTRKGPELYRVDLNIEGPFEQRDDETGSLELGDHPIARQISELLADDVPIFEQCMAAGIQRFGELTPFSGREGA